MVWQAVHLAKTASPASGEPPATNGGQQYPVHYLSGTVFAKQQLTAGYQAQEN